MRTTADTTKVAASTSNAPRVPINGMRTAASAAPTASNPNVPNPNTALAASRSSSATTRATPLRAAGPIVAAKIERITTNTNTTGSHRNENAMAITSTACNTSHVIINRRMSMRSASAPVQGANSVGAKSPARSNPATAMPFPV